MIPCTLYLVRHGQTDWNVAKTIQGQTDIPLNAKGEDQAHELKNALRDVKFDAVFSSDLLRAKRTAEILTLERNLAIKTAEAIRERQFGVYEGKPMLDTFEKLHEYLDEYKNHPHILESQVETNEQFMGRVITFIREVSVAYSGKRVLLVSHGNLMRAFLIHLGYCTPKQFPVMGHIKNLAYIQFECDGVEFKVITTEGIILEK
jgi:broad specificity phosphatase PhoE